MSESPKVKFEWPEKVGFMFEPHDFKVLYGGRNGIKCLAIGTKVIMFDGTLRPIEDVKIGECVMGPDSKPRAVLQTTSGTGPLYTVRQSNGINYTVNEAHILALKKSNSAKTDRRIMKSGNPRSPNGRYPSWPDVSLVGVTVAATQSKRWKEHFRGFKPEIIRFPHREVHIDPYFLGVWLGDGTGREMRITSADTEIIEYCRRLAESYGGTISVNKTESKAFDVGVKAGMSPGKNMLWRRFREYGLKDNKHIPHDYLANSETVRLNLMAGLMDTDGCLVRHGASLCYVITQTNEHLADQIKYLADTLGFRTNISRYQTMCSNNGKRGFAYRLSISGDIARIPCLLPHKRVDVNHPGPQTEFRLSKIQISRVPDGPWAGFTLDGDHLFMLEDGTVTHNSWTAAQAMLLIGANPKLLGRDHDSMRMLCARETMKSIAGSSHQLLKDQIARLGLQDEYEVLESAIKGKRNKTEITFVGLKDANALKSAESLDIVWVEEANTVSKESWEKLIPTIRKPGSEIWVTFNPELDTDDTYQRFVAHPLAGVKSCFLSWEDNPWISEKSLRQIEQMRREDPEKYAHIYGGQTVSAVQGAVYRAELAKCEEEGRICNVPHDPNRPVDTFWDLGFDDKTSIWCGQLFGGQYRMIDFIQSEGKTIQWYLKELDSRPYVYRTYYLPWDGTVAYKKLGSGKSTFEILMKLGKKVWLTSMIPIYDGINAVRSIFPQVVFDSVKCVDGIQSLRHYQWGEKKENQRKVEPLHNDWSHGADAFRTMAVGAKFPESSGEEVETTPKRRNTLLPPLLSGGTGGYTPFG